MTLKEAIELQTNFINDQAITHCNDLKDALKLSTEAMKRHQVRASLTYMDMMKPLPGETDED